MTNPIALVLGAFLILIIVFDVIFFGTDHLVFLGKKLLELIEWLAFWR